MAAVSPWPIPRITPLRTRSNSRKEPRAGCDPPGMNLMERLLPSCRRMARAASERLERRPALMDAFGIGLHLVFCSNCRRYRRQVAWIRDTARSGGQGRELSGGLHSARIRDGFRDRPRIGSETGGPGPAATRFGTQ